MERHSTASTIIRQNLRQAACWLSVIAVVIWLLFLIGSAVVFAAQPLPVWERTEPWAPHPKAEPKTSREESGEVVIRGNGTPTCCGGWQFVFGGVRPEQAYRFRVRVQHSGLDNARDSLNVNVLWDRWQSSQADTGQRPWNYLLPKAVSDTVMEFENVIRAPEGAEALTVRYIFRWSEQGQSRWSPPQIELAELPERKPVKIAIVNVTRTTAKRLKIESVADSKALGKDIAEGVDLYAALCLLACKEKPHLIVTPEVVIGGAKALEGSVDVPGPATAPFQKIAREHNVFIALGLWERDGDAFYNTVALISPDGGIAGRYRKVHLATSEGYSGVRAGNDFPVFDTAIGRLGAMICMDTTVEESTRMLALNGAEIICFPIMGDLRADRFTPGPPIYNESRWLAIMRTRAIDNQVVLAIARNNVQGSCIIDRKGDVLAWNEGDREGITATIPGDDGYRIWNGGDF
ncbi:MAG: carbon-nitrogen hydrolase family protein, partial [Candidatus Sumerlaeia bacterium]|nr:carbon-nitrogen hydrolase family protein [Candidatus Sumerlaeia bacterium]